MAAWPFPGLGTNSPGTVYIRASFLVQEGGRVREGAGQGPSPPALPLPPLRTAPEALQELRGPAGAGMGKGPGSSRLGSERTCESLALLTLRSGSSSNPSPAAFPPVPSAGSISVCCTPRQRWQVSAHARRRSAGSGRRHPAGTLLRLLGPHSQPPSGAWGFFLWLALCFPRGPHKPPALRAGGALHLSTHSTNVTQHLLWDRGTG